MASTAVSKLNRAWHEQHRMPPRATLDQRVKWHENHLKHCACRTDVPPAIAAEMEKRKRR